MYGLLNWMPDRAYLATVFRFMLDYPLNLKDPHTFSEKLQWLKLNDRRPEYRKMVDKLSVRKYIADTLGEEYLIPLLGVWNRPDEIDFDALPDQFVLKCSHNSGVGLCICKNKSKLDIDKTKKQLRKGLNHDYYLLGREWPYKNVPRNIIAEEYMVDDSGAELKDYKINCFNGVPAFVEVISGRGGHKYCLNHYDFAWQPLDLRERGFFPSDAPIPRPGLLDEMFEISRILSKNIPYVRIDLYLVLDRVFFGEITLFPLSGFINYLDFQTDLKLGDMIGLPGSKQGIERN